MILILEVGQFTVIFLFSMDLGIYMYGHNFIIIPLWYFVLTYSFYTF